MRRWLSAVVFALAIPGLPICAFGTLAALVMGRPTAGLWWMGVACCGIILSVGASSA